MIEQVANEENSPRGATQSCVREIHDGCVLERQERLRRAGIAWKVGQEFRYLFAGQNGSIWSGAKDRESGSRILDDSSLAAPLCGRCQDDSPGLNIGFEKISRFDTEPAAKGTR